MKLKLIFLSSIIFQIGLFAQSRYKINGGHSNIGFAIQWNEFGFRTGEFKAFGGQLNTTNDKNLVDAKVTLTVQVGSVDVIVPHLGKMLQNKEYLDSASCPFIFFKAENFKKKKKNIYTAKGELTIKCKPQTVEFIIEDSGRKGKNAFLKVTGSLSKKNWDITGGGERLGDLINITSYFELEKAE
jgi:polyisoprenoid-binding protein YceI